MLLSLKWRSLSLSLDTHTQYESLIISSDRMTTIQWALNATGLVSFFLLMYSKTICFGLVCSRVYFVSFHWKDENEIEIEIDIRYKRKVEQNGLNWNEHITAVCTYKCFFFLFIRNIWLNFILVFSSWLKSHLQGKRAKYSCELKRDRGKKATMFSLSIYITYYLYSCVY